MYPNPNDWLLVKALDEERWRRAQKGRQSRPTITRISLETQTGRNLFSWMRQRINIAGLRLKPVEDRICPGCCLDACSTTIAASL